MAQLVRAPPCHGGGRGFDPHPGRLNEYLMSSFRANFSTNLCGTKCTLNEYERKRSMSLVETYALAF